MSTKTKGNDRHGGRRTSMRRSKRFPPGRHAMAMLVMLFVSGMMIHVNHESHDIIMNGWQSLLSNDRGSSAGGMFFVDADPIELYGLNYNTRKGPDWDPSRCKTRAEVVRDVSLLRKLTKRIRILSLTDCNQGELVLDVVKRELGGDLGVFLGMWVSADAGVFENEVDELKRLMGQSYGEFRDGTILGVSVGSESIYREEVTAQENIAYARQVKTILSGEGLSDLPVTIVDVAPNFAVEPDLIPALDVVMTNSFPFWKGKDLSESIDFLREEIDPIIARASSLNKTVIVGETGWPSDGSDPDASVASPEWQAAYFTEFYCRIDRTLGWPYYYFTGIDNLWRQEQEPDNTIEGNFGLFYVDLRLKEQFANLVFTCPGDDGGDGDGDGDGGMNGTGRTTTFRFSENKLDDLGPLLPEPPGSGDTGGPPSPGTPPTSGGGGGATAVTAAPSILHVTKGATTVFIICSLSFIF